VSIPRIVATSCFFCGTPIEEEILSGAYGYTGKRFEYSQEGWTLLLNGKTAHTACANAATKDRLFVKEEPPVSS
jgi:hypothetical protein